MSMPLFRYGNGGELVAASFGLTAGLFSDSPLTP
jgi:hypothetical protein